MTLRGCYENMTEINQEKYEVKKYECYTGSLCNGASSEFGKVGMFLLLPITIVYII